MNAMEPYLDCRRLVWLQHWLALAALVLIGTTWPLWTGHHEFPSVPWFSSLTRVPLAVDAGALAFLISGLFGLLVAPPAGTLGLGQHWGRWLLGSIGLGGLVLLLLNQHRLQPWMYQFSWLWLIFAVAPRDRVLPLWRWVVIGIYFWSAVSKFDVTFSTTIGAQLIQGLWGAVGLAARDMPATTAAQWAWIFPTGELLAAAALVSRRTWRVGLVVSLFMHGSLLILLGPWAQEQEPGVLLWNLFFMGQNLLLFTAKRERVGVIPDENEDAEPTGGRWAECVLLGAFLLLPALDLGDRLDHWPAWSVYAPGAERVTLVLDPGGAEKLPVEARQFVGEPSWTDETQMVRTDLWSLGTLSVPIYPQGRFRAGVAVAVVERYGLDAEARLVVDTRADRLTGKRDRTEFRGRAAIERHARSYRINTMAR